jgi:hypothetical protein
MAVHTLLDEYENGWKAVRGEASFYAELPSGEKIEFGSSAVRPNGRRVRLFVALCSLLGELPLLDSSDVVPVRVAAAGKPEIAAYLTAVHEDLHQVAIANVIGVSLDTVSAYNGRVLRKAGERKIAGLGW